MKHNFVHMELSSDNLPKAREFYIELFKWPYKEVAMKFGGNYTIIESDDGPDIGMMKKQHPQAPPMWLPYVLVDSVDATVAKARTIGAHIILAKKPNPVGHLAVMIDPTGAWFGIQDRNK